MKTFSFPEQCGKVTALAWSPSGQQIAAACEDGTAIVWTVSSGEVLWYRRLTRARLRTVAWTGHGRYLACGGEDATLTVVEIRDGTVVASLPFDAPLQKIVFAPRGDCLLVAAGKTISVYYGQWRTPVKLLQPSPVLDVAWSPTGGRFAAVCSHGDVFVYNVLRRRVVFTLTDVYSPCSVAWNGDGRDVAIGTAKGTLQVHDGGTGDRFTTYTLSSHRLSHLSWGHASLAVLDACAEITLWNVSPREQRTRLAQRYPSAQQAFAFSPNGEHIATCTQYVCIAPVRV